jgi:hypothetical protein
MTEINLLNDFYMDCAIAKTEKNIMTTKIITA